MKKILFGLWILGSVCSTQLVLGQVDPHFSQYYIQPATLNPALTGAMQGDYRVTAIWKSQFGNTLSSRGVAAEMSTNRNLNVGVNIFNQASSNKAYQYTTANLSLAYTGIRFEDHYLTMALQAGAINRFFNRSKLQFGDQWTMGMGFDESNVGSEVFTRPSVTIMDVGAGVLYYDATPEKKVNLYGGISAFHLSRPADPFIASGTKERMPIRYSAHGGARVWINPFFSMVPTVLYMRQGNAQETSVGTYLQVSANEVTDLMFGTNLRIGNAFIPFVGFYHKGLAVGMSYDVGIANQGTSINRNSMEVSLSYVWWRSKSTETKGAFCPRF